MIMVLLLILMITPLICLNLKKKIGHSGGNSAKDAAIMVPLKCLNNFWRPFEVLLINCEINLMLTWSANCVISSNAAANQVTTFEITDPKLDFLVVTLSTKDIKKLLQQSKLGFKCME